MTGLATFAIAGCLAIGGPSDRILARDLAAAIPGFAPPVPDAFIALSPAPGLRRVFHVPELQRMAVRLHWEIEFSADICLERRVAPPDPSEWLAAMQRTLPGTDLHLVDYSRQSLPEGQIEFPASGMRSSGESALWMGYVRYGGNRRFIIWARVRVESSVQRLVAVADLRAGERITAEHLRLETRIGFPAAGSPLGSIDQAIGRSPRMPVRAGTVLRAEMIEESREVMRGDTVKVEVRAGAARLELDAKAESSGSTGQMITVINTESHKRFAARVEGQGRASTMLPKGSL